MSITVSPNVVKDGLILYFNMYNANKSWKGRPVINQFAIPTPDGSGNVSFAVNGTGTFQRVFSGTYGDYDIQPTDIVYRYDLGGLGCHYHGNDVTINSGQTATWSFDYYVSPTVTGYPSTNYLANFEGVIGGSIGDPTPTVIGTWKRISFTGTAGSTGLCRMLIYPGACGDRLATGGFVLFKNPQVEFDAPGNNPSPFVAGTRSSTQSISDLTNNNTITATSLTYASDGTFSFNGSSNYLTISNFVNKPTTAITCEAWIKPTKSTLSGTIRGGAISATNSMYLGIIDSIDGGATHALHWANQTSINRVTSWNGNVPNNAWSHIAGTYDGSTMRAYLNGVEIYSAAQSGTITDGTYVIGTYGGGLQDGVHNFHGILPEGKIYNRALSAEEIKQNFNATRSRYGI
jgi:hypothetical protein